MDKGDTGDVPDDLQTVIDNLTEMLDLLISEHNYALTKWAGGSIRTLPLLNTYMKGLTPNAY